MGKGDRFLVDVSSVPLVRGDQVIGVFGQAFHEEEVHGAETAPGSHAETDRGPPPPRTRPLDEADRGRLHLSRETVRNHVATSCMRWGELSLEAVAVARSEHYIDN